MDIDSLRFTVNPTAVSGLIKTSSCLKVKGNNNYADLYSVHASLILVSNGSYPCRSNPGKSIFIVSN
jgi:hypothetical protein